MLVPIKTIAQAAALLANGELVIYPTETAYALGADATNKEAVGKVFAVKERSKLKALPVIMADMTMVRQYVRVAATARQLAKDYWPGPLTLVLPTAQRRLYTSHHSTQALRISGNNTARSLAAALGRPIVATSANRSGKGNTYSLNALKKQFAKSKQPVYVLGKKKLAKRASTTIVKPHGPHVIVLRQGAIHIS